MKMKIRILFPILFATLLIAFYACQNTEGDASWAAFKKCASNKCVKEALAVKDALVKDPRHLLTDFQATYEKGQDHLIGWLYLMRDSVLTNTQMGALDKRIEMRNAIIKAVKPFENDAKLKEITKTVVDGMEHIAMMAETEGSGEMAPPVLSKKDSSIVALMVGEWTSKDDPKAGIKLSDGKFLFMYAGQKPEPTLSYVYYPSCPKDCNPVAEMPCLKVTGQDDVCYAVIKADGKVLELSQIGGTGNTNRYTRKR